MVLLRRRSYINLRSPETKVDDSVILSYESMLDESPQKSEISKVYQHLEKKISIKPQLFIYIEMFLYYGSLVYKNFRYPKGTLYPFLDLHLIPQNHPEYFSKTKVDWFYQKRAAFLMKPVYGRGSLNNLWKTYLDDVNLQYRLFTKEVDDAGVEWVKENPSCIRDTKSIKQLYQNIIDDERNFQLMVRFRPFATETHKGKQVNFKPNHYLDNQANNKKEIIRKLSDIYPDNMFKERHSFLITDHIDEILGMKQGKDDINQILNLKATAEQLSIETGNHKWIDIYKDIELQKIDYQFGEVMPAEFFLDSVNHVIGRLGAGKSILTKLLTRNLIVHGKKILILENDVLKCFQLLQELKEIGVTAAVFLGDGNINKHQTDYANTHMGKAENLSMFIADHEEPFKILSDFNLTHEFIKEHFEHARKPRNQVISLELDDKTMDFVAPDYSFNGDYEKYRLLAGADVWIGNYEAFLKTKVPYYVDIFERNFLTLGWLRSDLIIADEYDLAQQRFDNAMIQNLKLVTDRTDKINNFLDYMYNVVTEINKSATKGFVGNYADAVGTSQRIGRYLYSKIFPKRVIRDVLKNKTFTLDNLVNVFVNNFIQESKNRSEVIKTMTQYINNPAAQLQDTAKTFRLLYMELMDYYLPRGNIELSEGEKEEARQELMISILGKLKNKFGIAFKERAFENNKYSLEIIDRLDLILSFSIFDHKNRFLINEYATFMMYLEEENRDLVGSFNKMIQPNKEPYIAAPLLNNLIAYKFSTQDDDNDKLEMLYYFGVGRSLLSSLSDVYEHIENIPKPTVLLLSATSYIPGSSTYHTKVTPHWLLSNRNQTSQKIELLYMPVTDIVEHQPIKVSGLSTIFNKEAALRNLVRYFVKAGQFNRDISRMEKEFESLLAPEKNTGKRRIIAFPVFSFELAEVLGRILKEETNLNVRVHFKDGKYCKGVKIEYKPDFHLRKNDLEKLYEEEVDLFVFVANSVGRGLNILQGKSNKNSLIGTMYFLIRPYPNPDDFNEVIHQLHSSFETFLKTSRNEFAYDEPLFKLWHSIEGKVRRLYNELMNKRIFWKSLSDENKRIITLNMLTMIYQTIGRGLRGDSNLHVYLVDAAFAPATADKSVNGLPVQPGEEKYNSSMLAMMEHILTNESDFLLDVLFAPLKEAIQGKALAKKEEIVK